MRRSRGSNRVLRPVSLDIVTGPPVGVDDLSTWTSSETIETMLLPEPAIDPEDETPPESIQVTYPLVVDVTNIINPSAAASVGSLRFRSSSGVRYGHYRTSTGRILLGGNFSSGMNSFTVFWGKAGATQPGGGFPSAADVMFPYRLALIFEGNAPVDLSPDPATWTIVGTPTFTASGPLGNAMTCASGSYISTTAAKLRTDARDHRSAFIVFSVKTTEAEARLLSWANWTANQRAWMLWVGPYLELYISSTGTAFQPFRYPEPATSGWNAAGGAWKATDADAIYLLNGKAGLTQSSFEAIATGELFDSSAPYIVGGTPVAGAFHDDKINCLFELKAPFQSPAHLLWWELAWAKNGVFWGELDITPDNFDVPAQSGIPLSTEVEFARKQITGISSDTPISTSGGGNPTYSIGSSFSVPADLKAKGGTPGTIDPGNWLASAHTSAGTNSTITQSSVTIGTVTSSRQSTTVAATGPGGDGDPDGPATVTVTSLAALIAAFYAAKNGDVIEIAAGDYKSQGQLSLSNKDFRGGAKVWLRASNRGYRGFLPAQGGLWVSGETFFVPGSSGFEVGYLRLSNVHNVGFDGLRTYRGGTLDSFSSADVIGCTNISFQYSKFCGYKPTTDESTWTIQAPATDNPWSLVPYGMRVGVGGFCDAITFRHCLFHYYSGALFLLGVSNPIVEDCMFTDHHSDHLRNDGGQANCLIRRTMFGRLFPKRQVDGGIPHCDNIQNTTITQPGWLNHKIEMCVMGPSNSNYPHFQGPFYSCNRYPEYPAGDGLQITDCMIEVRPTNGLRVYPAKNVILTRNMILAVQYGGRINNRDPTFHNPLILLNVQGQSLGGNKIDRCIHNGYDIGAGTTVVDNAYMPPADYPTHLHNYPIYSSSQWHQVNWLDPYKGVIIPEEMKKWSPKTSSPYHPNNKGYHFGASAVLQHFGALT